jgi:hypothetical protein
LSKFKFGNTSLGLRPRLQSIRDSPLGLVLRLFHGIFLANKHEALVAHWAKQLKVSKLQLRTLRSSLNKTEALFVLGSGESVENLRPEDFSHIKSQTSIGINAWPLHPFVADFYAFEPFAPESADYVRLFDVVLHESRFADVKPKLFLFRPHTESDASRYKKIPRPLLEKALIYGRYVPITAKRSTLRSEIRALHWLSTHQLLGNSLVMDLGATIVRMVSLGYSLGFQDIVLVGVDLNGGKYFWEKNKTYLSDRKLKSFSPGHQRKIHETLVRDHKAFIVTETLEELQNLLARSGKTLWVGSSDSLLAEFLPVYPWDSKSTNNQTNRRFLGEADL